MKKKNVYRTYGAEKITAPKKPAVSVKAEKTVGGDLRVKKGKD